MRRLEQAGLGIGHRVLELGCLREKSSKRETRMLNILLFITSVVWKMLFGSAAKDAVSLEKSVEQDDQFMIVEKQPVVSTYISSAPCSCNAFVAGIVRGVCAAALCTNPTHTARAGSCSRPPVLAYAGLRARNFRRVSPRMTTTHAQSYSSNSPQR